MVGRPSSYSDEIAEEICSRLEKGESLRKICEDEHIPSRSTVLRWMRDDDAFGAKCARAREGQADWLHDEMSDIETGVLEGRIDPTAARVVLSSKQWRASKLAPKKYGDKVLNEHSGPNGEPIQTQSTVLDAKSLTWDERQKMREILLAAQERNAKGG